MEMYMNFLDRFARKHPRFGINNLMLHVTILTAIVFVVQNVFGRDIISWMYLNRELVFGMQLWRLVSFLFIPATNSIFWIFITLYFYYFLGSALENAWGTCKFNLFYLFSALGTIVAALVFGGIYSGFYVNLSIFLAFAALYPEQEFMVFFILPVKAKWLALLDGVYLGYNFIMGLLTRNWSIPLAILASLTGFLLFFGGDVIGGIKAYIRRQRYRRRLK
mgnify:CR=1 FL=1